MNPDEFEYERLTISVTAGTNQKFHQGMALLWTWCNRTVQITVVFLAIAALCLSFRPPDDELRHKWELTCGIAAVIAAVVLNVIQFGDWALVHRELFRRWTDLREDVDALPFEMAGEISKTASLVRLKQQRDDFLVWYEAQQRRVSEPPRHQTLHLRLALFVFGRQAIPHLGLCFIAKDGSRESINTAKHDEHDRL